jgi:hypothetical protein
MAGPRRAERMPPGSQEEEFAMHRITAPLLAIALVVSFGALGTFNTAAAEQEGPQPVTVKGKSACAACDGDIEGHDILLYTDGGIRFVVKGTGPDYKEAHQVRMQGLQMTATLSGPIQPKEDVNGDPYLEAEVSSIEIEES